MFLLLGFGGKEVKLPTDRTPLCRCHMMNSLYVYRDIVQPHVVGNTDEKFLRTANVEEKMYEMIS